MGRNNRRACGKIDKLPPDLKDTVDQMLVSGQTYREIVSYLADNGEQLSQAAVSRYASRFRALLFGYKIYSRLILPIPK